MKTLISIKTYKKNDVLQCLLTSLNKHGYTENSEIVVADDNPGEAYEVFQANPFVSAYLAGNRHGIGLNSNRLIRYFLQSDCDRLALLDNDICMKAPGLFEEIETSANTANLTHMTCYIIDSDGGDGLQAAFPAVAISKDRGVKWHTGSHGVLQWYTRDLIDKIGYFAKFPYFYGGEHSEHSNRALIHLGYDPEVYPVLARSTKFIQSCPINLHAYDVDMQKVFQDNYGVMHSRLAQTKKGLDLKEYNSHLDLAHELVLTDRDLDPKSILASIKQGNKRRR